MVEYPDEAPSESIDKLINVSHGTAMAYYHGKIDFKKRAAALMPYFEPSEFQIYLDMRLNDTAKQLLADAFADLLPESGALTITQDCSQLLYDIYREIASADSHSPASDPVSENQKTSDNTAPFNEMFLRIWKASHTSFMLSRRLGSRFQELHILDTLLPKGQFSDTPFTIHAAAEDSEIRDIMQIYGEDDQDLLIYGEGGIGKTTFLQHLLQDAFMKEQEGTLSYIDFPASDTLPIYIELSRYLTDFTGVTDNKKTELLSKVLEDKDMMPLVTPDFILRTIADMMITAFQDFGEDKTELMQELEREFIRCPEDLRPRYVLLLDGFNEVTLTGEGNTETIRTLLSREIRLIQEKYFNVRVIVTSRVIRTLYFSDSFKSVELTGLRTKDIVSFLNTCGKIEDHREIEIYSNDRLMECLRIPLFLCLFAAVFDHSAETPETAGAILYQFFHGKNRQYNQHQSTRNSRNWKLDKYDRTLILEFILPYIAWNYTQKEVFFVSSSELQEVIANSLNVLDQLFVDSYTGDFVPYESFRSDRSILAGSITKLISNRAYINRIAECIHEQMGILYRTEAPGAKGANYAFIHHHIRDYFSSFFVVQLLRMLPYLEDTTYLREIAGDHEQDTAGYAAVLNSYYLNYQETRFISEILSEDKNRPVLEKDGNWHINLPENTNDLRNVLEQAIVFCRRVQRSEPTSTRYLLRNVLEALYMGRGELSGVDLSELNLHGISVFNTQCIRYGETQNLAASFRDCTLSQEFLHSPGDLHILQHALTDSRRYAYTSDNIIYIYNNRGSCLEHRISVPGGTVRLYSRILDFFKISPDERHLAVSVVENNNAGTTPGKHSVIYIYPLDDLNAEPIRITPPYAFCRVALDYSFSPDSRQIYVLFANDSHDRTGFLFVYSLEDPSAYIWETLQYTLSIPKLYPSADNSGIYLLCSDIICDDRYIDEETNPYGTVRVNELLRAPLENSGEIPASCNTLVRISRTGMNSSITAYSSALDAFIFYHQEKQAVIMLMIRNRRTAYLNRVKEQPAKIAVFPEEPSLCYIYYSDKGVVYDLHSAKQIRTFIVQDLPVYYEPAMSGEEPKPAVVENELLAASRTRLLIRYADITYDYSITDGILTPWKEHETYENAGILLDDVLHNRLLFACHNSIAFLEGSPLRFSKITTIKDLAKELTFSFDPVNTVYSGSSNLVATYDIHENILTYVDFNKMSLVMQMLPESFSIPEYDDGRYSKAKRQLRTFVLNHSGTHLLIVADRKNLVEYDFRSDTWTDLSALIENTIPHPFSFMDAVYSVTTDGKDCLCVLAAEISEDLNSCVMRCYIFAHWLPDGTYTDSYVLMSYYIPPVIPEGTPVQEIFIDHYVHVLKSPRAFSEADSLVYGKRAGNIPGHRNPINTVSEDSIPGLPNLNLYYMRTNLHSDEVNPGRIQSDGSVLLAGDKTDIYLETFEDNGTMQKLSKWNVPGTVGACPVSRQFILRSKSGRKLVAVSSHGNNVYLHEQDKTTELTFHDHVYITGCDFSGAKGDSETMKIVYDMTDAERPPGFMDI